MAIAATVFRQAVPKDWQSVKGLLESCSLPLDGARQHFIDFLLAFEDGALAACGGLECYGDVALLRSVAVVPQHRGTGLGRELCGRLLASAKQRNIRTVALLTESAQDFFLKMGFEVVSRTMLPEAVKVSEELRGACPQTAIAMLRHLA
jgi:amino-acid N-acetyltransferase